MVAYCDHTEQMIPPVKALGSEYAAVSYRQRSTTPEKPLWRVIGAMKGNDAHLRSADRRSAVPGESRRRDRHSTSTPFTVTHATGALRRFRRGGAYMSGSEAVVEGYGDADFVRITAADQYLSRYIFFTDPTFPETNLVVIRKKGMSGFADVTLDCAGKLGGWIALRIRRHVQWTRTDLSRHDFAPQGNCDNGRHEMTSTEPFGLWVWGWGTPEAIFTANVSYGLPSRRERRPHQQRRDPTDTEVRFLGH